MDNIVKTLQNNVKNNVFQKKNVYMFELASGIGTWKNWRKLSKIAVFSRVWGDKGIGSTVKKGYFGRFYGDKCVNYRVWRKTLQKHADTLQKTRDLDDFVERNADNGAKCRLDSFSGRRRRGYLKFPSLGGPHGRENIKKHPLGGSQGGGNRSPGRPGLRMAANLFEIEMQNDANNMHKCWKTNSYVCKLLSPCHGPKKTCGVGGHPTRSGVNTYETWNVSSLKCPVTRDARGKVCKSESRMHEGCRTCGHGQKWSESKL